MNQDLNKHSRTDRTPLNEAENGSRSRCDLYIKKSKTRKTNESRLDLEPPRKEENYVEFWILLFFLVPPHVHWTFLSSRYKP